MEKEQQSGLITDMAQKSLGLVIDGLQQLINLTEEKYAYIYETLPKSEQSIHDNVREVELLLTYLLGGVRASVSQTRSAVVNQVLEAAFEGFEQVANSLVDRELLLMVNRTFMADSSDKEEQSFAVVSKVAQDVNETLMELKDVALNSIIFATRAGEEGLGFRILSDQINLVSEDLSLRFASLEEVIQQLKSWNIDFLASLNNVQRIDSELQREHKDRIKQEFAKTLRATKVTTEFLQDFLSRSKMLLARVPEVMVLIQSQDIIRQNLENVKKCLELALDKRTSLNSRNTDAVLDYLVFLKKVNEIAFVLIDNINTELNESLSALEEFLAEIGEQARDLKEDGEYLGRFLTDVLYYNLTNSQAQIGSLMESRDRIVSLHEQISLDSGYFHKLMRDAEMHFSDIDRQLRQLKRMRVLLKIELARISNTSQFAMSDIIGTIESVVNTVETNRQLFIKLRSHFESNLKGFNTVLAGTEARIHMVEKRLSGVNAGLGHINHLGTDLVRYTVIELGDVCVQLQLPYQQMRARDVVAASLGRLREELWSFNNQVLKVTEDILEKCGLDYWEEKGEDLQSLLNQFTCFVERQAACEIFGEETQSQALGSHSDDIVLF